MAGAGNEKEQRSRPRRDDDDDRRRRSERAPRTKGKEPPSTLREPHGVAWHGMAWRNGSRWDCGETGAAKAGDNDGVHTLRQLDGDCLLTRCAHKAATAAWRGVGIAVAGRGAWGVGVGAGMAAPADDDEEDTVLYCAVCTRGEWKWART